MSRIIADDEYARLEEVACWTGYSLKHLERMIKNGVGPKMTKLGPRKRAVLGRHYREWREALVGENTPEAA